MDQQGNVKVTGGDQNNFCVHFCQRGQSACCNAATGNHILTKQVDLGIATGNQRGIGLGSRRDGLHDCGKIAVAGGKTEIHRRTARGTLADHIHHNACLGKHLQMLCQALCAVLGSGEGGKHNILLAADFADTVHKNTPFVLF